MSARGFTLLELIVVLAITAMAIALVGPALGTGASGSELRAAARDLAAGLRVTRGEAIRRQRETALELDVETRRYRIGGDPRVYPLPEKLDIKLVTAEAEITGEHTGAIRFYPDGSSTGGRITLAAGERHYDVDVHWLTGRVSILD